MSEFHNLQVSDPLYGTGTVCDGHHPSPCYGSVTQKESKDSGQYSGDSFPRPPALDHQYTSLRPLRVQQKVPRSGSPISKTPERRPLIDGAVKPCETTTTPTSNTYSVTTPFGPYTYPFGPVDVRVSLVLNPPRTTIFRVDGGKRTLPTTDTPSWTEDDRCRRNRRSWSRSILQCVKPRSRDSSRSLVRDDVAVPT